MLQRILLIEDSEGEALLVKQMLRQAGLQDPVVWIHSSEAAITYLLSLAEMAAANDSSQPLPEIILLDLAMPNIDGYAFLRWLRQQPGLSKIIVVVLTGEMDPKRIRLAYQLGANSFLSKHAGIEEYMNFVEFFQSFSRVAYLLPKETGAPSTLPSIQPLPDNDEEGGDVVPKVNTAR